MISSNKPPPSGSNCYCKDMAHWAQRFICSAGHARSQTSLLTPGWADQLRGLGHSHGTGGDGQHTCWEHNNNGEPCKDCKKSRTDSEDGWSHFLAQKAVQSLPMLSLHAVLYNTWKKITENGWDLWRETRQKQVLIWRLTYQEHQTV